MSACTAPAEAPSEAAVSRTASSSRRPPIHPWSEADRRRVRATVDESLRSPYFAAAGVALAGDDGELIYGRNAQHDYAPASTLKAIVAAVALGRLGTKARLETRFESLEQPDAVGTIDDLWLVGGGDPVLDPDQLKGGVGALFARGVRHITGDLIVDATSFREPEQNPAWAPDDFEYEYAAGTSPISLNWDVIEFKIAPTQIGAPARVRVFPASSDVVVRGAPTTGYGTLLRITRSAPGRNEFVVEGTIAPGGEQSFFRPVVGIPMWAGLVAGQMLRDRGIALDGEVRLGEDPHAMQTLWDHRSPPLAKMVKQMLFESDNHIAEQLLGVIGGPAAAKAYLEQLGIAEPGLRLVDGSGLAESDRVAPQTFVQLLQAAARSPFGETYVTSLPRAGIEGTVRHHDLHAALGLVRAKSGHIADVNALVGYVDSRRHGKLAFAFLVNAPGADDATSIQVGIDRMLDALALL
ncbi:MAG: D-alanyl-D-alanine carboxypeptidase/D-alanyl-D-alanine-endopeptidase [Candidatus Eremiobacteraeota bacterium]|nr:D-alanyl-D-alanine carboxypeptidase/D-alanyl-D-alanine-endopeptidase [Candidatus Eremiobacteraeota bacterium]